MGVVYEIPCQGCSQVYIGEIGISLQKRLSEHKAAVKRGDRSNGIAVHVWDEGHQVNWDGATVMEIESHQGRRKILEAIQIQGHPKTANLDRGFTVNHVWHNFINPPINTTTVHFYLFFLHYQLF